MPDEKRTRKSVIVPLVCLAIIGLSSACQEPSTLGARDTAFEALFPFEFNEGLSLTQPEALRESGSPGVADLLLENHYEVPVMIAAEDGTRILLYSEATEGWTELRDRVISTEGDYVLSAAGGPLSFDVVNVSPDLDSSDLPVEVRVVITGRLMNGDRATDNRVGAFLDVVIDGP